MTALGETFGGLELLSKHDLAASPNGGFGLGILSWLVNSLSLPRNIVRCAGAVSRAEDAVAIGCKNPCIHLVEWRTLCRR